MWNTKQRFNTTLIVILYSINDLLENIIFDLHWGNLKTSVLGLFVRTHTKIGYPASGQDYLDASCLVFDKKNFLEPIDYSKRSTAGIVHSGDRMTSTTGHHYIHIDLKSLNNNVTNCFFTLSAWNSPTIEYYPNPSMTMYDKQQPTVPLCNYGRFDFFFSKMKNINM